MKDISLDLIDTKLYYKQMRIEEMEVFEPQKSEDGE